MNNSITRPPEKFETQDDFLSVGAKTSSEPLQNSRSRVLVFSRFYLATDFRDNVAPLADEFEFSFLVDGHSPGTEDTRERFYTAIRRGERCDLLATVDEEDVVDRCRLLRHLPRSRAIHMMHAMACALEKVFQRTRPSAVLCHMVDDYVTHLVFLLASKRGLGFVGYFYSYFPGFIQITDHSNGRAFKVREPSEDEVACTLETASNRFFRQNYNQQGSYSLRTHFYRIMRYRVKQVVFRCKSIFQRDPDNLHYAVTPFVAERRRLRDFPRQSDFHLHWREELARLRASCNGLVVYFPLGYFPESAIDYWTEDRSIINYEQCVLEMLTVLGQDGIVLVKEHLHMMGARNSELYRTIKKIKGVVSVPPLEYSNDVLGAADAVVLGGGSIGIEATLRGKPTFSFCESAYWFRPSRAFRLSISEVGHWPEQIKSKLKCFTPFSNEGKSEFIRDCLRTTVRQRAAGSRWPHINVEDLRSMLHRATQKKASKLIIYTPKGKA